MTPDMRPQMRPMVMNGRWPLAALALALPLLMAPAAVMAMPGGGCPMHGQMHPGGGAPRALARLTVAGEGQARVAPDMATISLGVTTQAPTAAEAMAQNSARQQTVIEALKAQGIAPEDIQTSGLNLSPLMNYPEGQPPQLTGYQAQNMVTIRVLDLPRLGTVLDAIVGAGANEVNGISFGLTDPQAAEDAARTDAVAEARRRAEVLAAAAGMRVGPVLAIRDTALGQRPQPMAEMAMDAKAAGAVPIEAGRLGVTATVEMDFALATEGGEGMQPGGAGCDHDMGGQMGGGMHRGMMQGGMMHGMAGMQGMAGEVPPPPLDSPASAGN